MNIVLAQLNYQIGDFEENYHKILSVIQTHHTTTDLIVFSELCLCGYYPYDLLERPAFIALHDFYLNKLIQYTNNIMCAIILGVITKNTGPGKPLHNSLVVIHQGNIIYTYHKKLLPTYNIFDEARHFEPGPISGQNTHGLFIFKNQTIGFLICEDGWANHSDLNYPIKPADSFTQHTVDLIIAINGSPSNLKKQADRITIFGEIAQKAQAPLLFCNQVGGYDDIVFDGGSFILDKQGQAIANLPYFDSSLGKLVFENSPTQSKHLTYIKSLESLDSLDSFKPFYYLSNIELIYKQILLGLTDYVYKCHFKGIVIGLSGGMDSALTLTLAVKALGNTHVKAIFMPTRYTAHQSQEDSEQLCKNLNVDLFHLNIDEEFGFALNQFKATFKQEPHKITKQNIQARIRGRILMEYSNQTGFLVLSTGNKSELSCGYTTLYGDMIGGLNLIGDLYKTDVYDLANFINAQHALNPPIPAAIIARPPTAELEYNQKDADDLLPYPQLDAILKLYIEGDLLDSAEKATLQAISDTVAPELILTIHTMVDKAEFKRRQSAPIIRVQKRAFGYGRRIPIARFISN